MDKLLTEFQDLFRLVSFPNGPDFIDPTPDGAPETKRGNRNTHAITTAVQQHNQKPNEE
jgi:hypothetical protein